MEAIYRFRSADKLLDDRFGEFNQIYLANSEMLNDPMEGFFKITFNGNRTLWLNFFKHFFQSIWFMWMSVALKQGRYHLSEQDVIIGNRDKMSDDFLFDEIFRDFEFSWTKFCAECSLQEIFARLEKCRCPLNAAMVEQILHMIIPHAIYYVGFTDESHSSSNTNSLRNDLLTFIEHLDDESLTTGTKHDLSLGILRVIDTRNYNSLNGLNIFTDNYRFLIRDFNHFFMRKILYLCTPNVFLSSFSKSFQHPLTWAHYADGNKGVCLIFNKNADYLIQGANEKTHFYPVKYDFQTMELNFFTTIFRVNGAQALNRWQSLNVCSESGSELFDRILYPYMHKLKEWEYEQEERLLIDDFMRDKISQKVVINDSHLKGVIFGSRMPSNQKKEIIDKARMLGLNSLKYYHAVWSEQNRGVRAFDENSVELK